MAGLPQPNASEPSDLAAVDSRAHTAKPMRFERSCLYCGARFEVTAGELPGQPEPQEYDCPECGKQHEVVTTGLPLVRLLRPRSDGKNDRYQDTMF
jgi:transcription elongation factor Elf1